MSPKTVTFSTISIRCHDVTIGDSPSVSSGIPISLDWTFVDKDAISLDDFEEQRSPRRPNFVLSASQRRERLVTRFGLNPWVLMLFVRRRRALGYYRNTRPVLFPPKKHAKRHSSASTTITEPISFECDI